MGDELHSSVEPSFHFQLCHQAVGPGANGRASESNPLHRFLLDFLLTLSSLVFPIPVNGMVICSAAQMQNLGVILDFTKLLSLHYILQRFSAACRLNKIQPLIALYKGPRKLPTPPLPMPPPDTQPRSLFLSLFLLQDSRENKPFPWESSFPSSSPDQPIPQASHKSPAPFLTALTTVRGYLASSVPWSLSPLS